jgi:predicted secreted protein
MKIRIVPLLAVLLAVTIALPAAAQAPMRDPATATVNVTASATVTLPNDRMTAWLRAEGENASAKAAAADVNARVTRALARIKAIPSITASSAGYGTDQISDKGKPVRWRVAQTIKLESADFATLAGEIGNLQDDGMLFSGMAFSLSEDARRTAEDSVTQQAIRAWQQRAQNAASALGYASWRVGDVNVQTNDSGRPFPIMRSDMKMMAAAASPPPPVEAGTADVTVTVNGVAVLQSPK